MKWIVWGLVLVLPGGCLLYALGWLILRRQGYRWRGVPPVYDGKEPFAQWAKKMERARRLQAHEDRVD